MGEGEGGGKLPFIIRTELCILASLLWGTFLLHMLGCKDYTLAYYDAMATV